LFLITGLGNPGKQYQDTRHNAGFLALDRIAHHHHLKISSKKFNSSYLETNLWENKVILLKPQTYMNLSGQAILAFCQYYKIPSHHVIVIHDDIDLPFSEVRTKTKGGHAGHNGLKSIMECLETDIFKRIRIGIGRPPTTIQNKEDDISNYVLSPFNSEQKKGLPTLFETVSQHLEKMLAELNSPVI